MADAVFVGGQLRAGSSAVSGDVVDPSTGQVVGAIARGTREDVDRAVAAARGAIGETFDGPWGRLTAAERGRLLMRLCAAVIPVGFIA